MFVESTYEPLGPVAELADAADLKSSFFMPNL